MRLSGDFARLIRRSSQHFRAAEAHLVEMGRLGALRVCSQGGRVQVFGFYRRDAALESARDRTGSASRALGIDPR